MASKKDVIVVEGTVDEILPGAKFRVKLDNDHEITAYLGGKMRTYKIRIGVGDKVRLEMTPYDLTKGRITYRL
ncbi:MAG: translation initiation factor IF-1 [Candidatus Magasanikbacteria bacterium CG10_big_fil_rev_8_21_14_0_10_43_6]|uniref:Translation initiation factor IF-1 n=1 Tax=Candidatus Magasanikbacteria bacterium CG10_big_fil_rev_8_21_14_0_10_43_6 TaxID=1974650 RepID=A0A2M6W195_9BACT|nr:MAG: translation initiation factor IF-1 [Candidatus Magasanikbacteria bacterium CG10_big_fil_rev_8_21_14_0_10_43_6]